MPIVCVLARWRWWLLLNNCVPLRDIYSRETGHSARQVYTRLYAFCVSSQLNVSHSCTISFCSCLPFAPTEISPLRICAVCLHTATMLWVKVWPLDLTPSPNSDFRTGSVTPFTSGQEIGLVLAWPSAQINEVFPGCDYLGQCRPLWLHWLLELWLQVYVIGFKNWIDWGAAITGEWRPNSNLDLVFYWH